jgi:L-fucose isomerase-like protein
VIWIELENAMREIRRLKVGLAGLMCTPFKGDKEKYYQESRDALFGLADLHNFDLHVIEQGMYDDKQAKAAAAELSGWGADLVIMQTSSFGPGQFIYEFTKVPVFLGLWAIPEGPPAGGGGLPLNSFTAMNMYNSILGTRETGYKHPVKWFYGHPGQPLFDDRFIITLQALRAVVNLRGSRIGLIGGVAPGFDNLIVDYEELRDALGVEVVDIELEEIIDKARAYDTGRIKSAEKILLADNVTLAAGQEPAVEKSSRVLTAYQEIVRERELDALAVSCWPQFQEDYHLAVCSVIGAANQLGVVAACEGDVTSAVSMLALKYISGGGIVSLMDLSALDESDDSVLLWHCGPAPVSFADEGGVRMGSLWLFDGYEGEPIGLHNDLVLKPGAATVMGFSVDFQRMLVLNGVIDNAKPGYVGSRGWMSDIRLSDEDIDVPDLVETIMASNYQHHYPLIYGEYAPASMELAAWLGIRLIQRRNYRAYLQ